MLSTKLAICFAGRCVSRDETRPHLCQVNLEANRAWATDGHRAYLFTTAAAPAEIGAYDASGNRLNVAPAPPPIDQVIPSADTPIVLMLAPEHIAQLYAIKAVTASRAQRLLYAGDLQAFVRMVEFISAAREKKHVKPQRVNIPVSDLTATHEFGIDVDYLIEVIEALNFLPDESVELRQKAPLDPIRIDGRDGTAVIMPVSK